MTKEQLLTFIDNNYLDGEYLLWQVISKNDMESNIGKTIEPEHWSMFIDELALDCDWTDVVSEHATELFNDYEPENDDE
jgi:hypothetical protein